MQAIGIYYRILGRRRTPISLFPKALLLPLVCIFTASRWWPLDASSDYQLIKAEAYFIVQQRVAYSPRKHGCRFRPLPAPHSPSRRGCRTAIAFPSASKENVVPK